MRIRAAVCCCTRTECSSSRLADSGNTNFLHALYVYLAAVALDLPQHNAIPSIAKGATCPRLVHAVAVTWCCLCYMFLRVPGDRILTCNITLTAPTSSSVTPSCQQTVPCRSTSTLAIVLSIPRTCRTRSEARQHFVSEAGKSTLASSRTLRWGSHQALRILSVSYRA